MAKRKFLDTKNIGKKIMPAVVDGAVSGTGYLAGKIAANKLSEKNPKIVKVKGPAAFLLGSLIAATANDKDKTGHLIRQFGMGMSTYGAAEMADAFIPEDTKAKLGLSGLGLTDKEAEKLAEEAAKQVEAEFSGIYDENAYLPTGDDKPVDTADIDGGMVAINPLPGPLPIHNNSKTAPAPAPASQQQVFQTPVSKTLLGVDDDEALVEELM